MNGDGDICIGFGASHTLPVVTPHGLIAIRVDQGEFEKTSSGKRLSVDRDLPRIIDDLRKCTISKRYAEREKG